VFWSCSSPLDCPEPRPRIGDACTDPGVTCDYGACFGAPLLECQGGIWIEQDVACGGASG
jgi:hypothetical protein